MARSEWDPPNTKVGTFTQALYDEAKKDGRIVISMKSRPLLHRVTDVNNLTQNDTRGCGEARHLNLSPATNRTKHSLRAQHPRKSGAEPSPFAMDQ
jgi:hypothetical protein